MSAEPTADDTWNDEQPTECAYPGCPTVATVNGLCDEHASNKTGA